MKQIAVKEIADVRYTLGAPTEAKGKYNQLKATFPDGKEYRLFADPVISGDKYIWMTEFEGSVINIMQLTEEEQSLTKNKLAIQIQKLLAAAKKFEDSTFLEFLYKCIEIPSLKDVYVVRNSDGDNVVLSQWGFILDTPGAEKGLLDKIVNAKRVPMLFKIQYEDESVAANEEVHFEFEDQKEIHKSNKDGFITIESVKVDSYVKAYELHKSEKLNEKGYTCYELGEYVFTVSQKADMLFRVKDSNGQILTNETFNFKFDGDEITLSTNEKGEMTLPKVRVGTEVNTSQNIEGRTENNNNFICEKDKEVYNIIIQVPETEVPVAEPPKEYEMKFKVLDHKDKPVANAEVTVKYGDITKTIITDSEGYTVLKDIEPGTKVKVIAKKKKK